jgi:formylglycine-generating enzyme required for sulfatase activity
MGCARVGQAMTVVVPLRYLVATGLGLVLGLAASSLHAQAPGTSFKDCPDCPEMVVVPAGSFLMGTANPRAAAYEKPQHRVTFAKPFAIGKYEVTQSEWMALMGDNPSSYIGPRRPVEGISWTEAQEFVRRLSMKTGKQYRLPTEAEWEYAARAGTSYDFLLGNNPAELDRYAWHVRNSGKQTQPVGGKEPNAFGLYDVIGNVYEWMQDCYVDHHDGAPTDGRAVAETAGCARVVKGGSHYGVPRNLRPSDRGRLVPDMFDSTLGLRVAKTLP